MIIDEFNPPHLDDLPSYVFGIERGLDPWHRDTFPTEVQDHFVRSAKRSEGWFLLDWCGNAVGFLPDGMDLRKK